MTGYFRVSSCVPKLRVGNTSYNTDKIIEKLQEAAQNGVNLAVFPELSITAYTCGDLFFQKSLLDGVTASLERIIECTSKLSISTVVGAPLYIDGELYNCAVLICAGKIKGIVPKTFVPNHAEFSEKRWFSSAFDLKLKELNISKLGIGKFGDYSVDIGNNLIFNLNNYVSIAIEICEDLWSPITPSNFAAVNGAEIIINLSASNEMVGKRKYRRDMVSLQSASLISGYVFTSSGCDESTTDLVFSGHSIIAENGTVIAENTNIIDNDYILCADFDMEKLRADRIRHKTFKEASVVFKNAIDFKFVDIYDDLKISSDGKLSTVERLPFVPSEKNKRSDVCKQIFEMQVSGLKKRLEVTASNIVIGISGGLDSTLALLVCVEAMRRLNRPLTQIYGITMPCFGTSDRTFNNSIKLMNILTVSNHTINIKNSCIEHFNDIGHSIDLLDATYENSQARERTQVLMDFASRVGGFVVGTGDLSELALGWCTYNGDHMSMYGVNCDVPKTLIRWIIEYLVESNTFSNSSDVLKDILDTPISPELLPPDASGKISQVTEDIVGPYALHDFFLYYMIRFGFAPKKIYDLAKRAFYNDFSDEVILKWLKTFYKRFFTQQFKRSCMPDGVKVGSVALSPRGDWRMPSDADARIWLEELESI